LTQARRMRGSGQWARRAREVFTLGWVMGVRYGHTHPALSHTPVSDEEAAAALRPLARPAEDQAPQLGQMVSYHGSLTAYHGRYWVTNIQASVESDGTAYTGYRLSEWTGTQYEHVAHHVRPQSVTPLSEFRPVRLTR
jgi:hypothetical protein